MAGDFASNSSWTNLVYYSLPKVELENLDILWGSGYDGLMLGYCIFKGVFYYSKMVQENRCFKDRPYYRRHGLIEVPKEEEIEARRRNKVWEDCVGTHSRFVNNKRISQKNPEYRYNDKDIKKYWKTREEWRDLPHTNSKNFVAWFER